MLRSVFKFAAWNTISFPEKHTLKFERFYDPNKLGGDSYSGMPSILTMFPHDTIPDAINNQSVRVYATEKANGVAILLTCLMDMDSKKSVILLHKPRPVKTSQYHVDWKTKLQANSDNLDNLNLNKRDAEDKRKIDKENIEKILVDVQDSYYSSILDSENEAYFFLQQKFAKMFEQQTDAVKGSHLVICSLRGELTIDKSLRSAVDWVKSTTSRSCQIPHGLAIKVWDNCTPSLKQDYKNFCWAIWMLTNLQTGDNPTKVIEMLKKVNEDTFSTNHTCNLKDIYCLRDVNFTAPDRLQTLQTLNNAFGTLSIQTKDNPFIKCVVSERNQITVRYAADKHILTAVPLLHNQCIENFTQQNWINLKQELLQHAYTRSEKFGCEGFVMFLEKKNIDESFTIVERCKIKPYFLQILSPFCAVFDPSKQNELARNLRLTDMQITDTFNNNYASRQTNSNDLSLTIEKYDEPAPNHKALKSKNDQKLQPIYAQLASGAFTQINSFKVNENSMKEMKIDSTRDVLESEQFGKMCLENVFKDRLCVLSWWGFGSKPESNQIVFQSVTDQIQFLKISALNNNNPNLLCVSANATQLLNYYDTHNQAGVFKDNVLNNHQHYAYQLQLHFARVVSVQVLFLYIGTCSLDALYALWPSCSTMIRQMIIACFNGGVNLRHSEEYHPLRARIVQNILSLSMRKTRTTTEMKFDDKWISKCEELLERMKQTTDCNDEIKMTMVMTYDYMIKKLFNLRTEKIENTNHFFEQVLYSIPQFKGKPLSNLLLPCHAVSKAHNEEEMDAAKVELDIQTFQSFYKSESSITLNDKKTLFLIKYGEEGYARRHITGPPTVQNANPRHIIHYSQYSQYNIQEKGMTRSKKYTRSKKPKYAVFDSGLHMRTIHGHSSSRCGRS